MAFARLQTDSRMAPSLQDRRLHPAGEKLGIRVLGLRSLQLDTRAGCFAAARRADAALPRPGGPVSSSGCAGGTHRDCHQATGKTQEETDLKHANRESGP